MLALAILMAAAAAIAYILILYPLLLAMLPFKTKPPVAKSFDHQPQVTAIVAVHNGAEFVRAKLESLLALDYPRERLRMIVVSDGSTDATESIVREFAHRGVELLPAPREGKAAALNRALAMASGEILFFTDVRQPLDGAALRHLAANFADPSVGAVTGEMRLERGDRGEQADMDLYWRYEIWARAKHSAIDSLFQVTGCIYAMRRSLAAPLPPDTLSDDAVLPLRAFFAGYRVVFDPAAIAIDHPAKAGTEFRRRRRNLGGLWQVFARHPRLFTERRMRVHFLSHKFARLMLPWALIAAVLATVGLPPGWFRDWNLAGAAGLLALALIDAAIPSKFFLKRISSPARTFLAMNLASLLALGVFFTDARRMWKSTQVERGES